MIRFCHIVTFRIGASGNAYIKVDETPATVSTQVIETNRAGFFRTSGVPSLLSDNIKEVYFYNEELDESCTPAIHNQLMGSYIVSL